MPQNPTPQKTAATAAPTQSFLQKMFGASQMTPEMQQGIDIARKENPNMAPVEPYGFFSRMLQPKAMAYASPGNSIYMNPDQNQGQSPQDIADTLTHEQEHIKQQQSSGYGPTMTLLRSMFSGPSVPYGQRPNEMAAFQAEKNRRYAMGRTQTPIASFQHPTESYVPQQGDINLPVERKSLGPSRPMR